jgi:TRAP-type mannitol/chloroaromatic compound transport system substrate-binding protein
MKFKAPALLLAAALFALTPAVNADAKQKKVRWKLATTWTSTLAPIAHAASELSRLVSDMTDGNFEIQVEGAEKHRAPLGILDMVKGGQYQMGHTASYYWKGKDPSAPLFTTTPFGMTPEEQFAWTWFNGGIDLQQKLYSKFGVYSWPGGNTSIQMGGWFKKEIKTLDDLQGLKMRIPGLAGEVFAKLGVNVTNIPAGELYTSLDRGTIDALEWVGPAMDLKMGFHKVAPWYYAGWHEPASDLQFLVNKQAFDRLPKNYQAILKSAMQQVNFEDYAENFDANVKAWQQIKKEHPEIKIMTFPKPVLQAMKKATDEVLSGYAAQDPLFKEIMDSQNAYMKEAREWTNNSTLYYLETSNAVRD